MIVEFLCLWSSVSAVNCPFFVFYDAITSLLGFSIIWKPKEKVTIMAEAADFVKNKINNGTYSVANKHKGKSVIWSILCDILKEDETVLDGWLFCRQCQKVLKFLHKNTSNLSRHKCCLTLRRPTELKIVSENDKKVAIEKCTQWVVQDCRPFSAVTGAGFKNLVKFFLQIGAIYGEQVDVDDLLPDPTTLSRKAKSDAEEKRSLISSEIKKAVDSGRASATVDMWTDQYVQRNFLGITFHYEKEFKLCDMILGLKSMNFQKSTAENILMKIKGLFSEFNVENIDNVKFVTDRGANIKKALEGNTRLNCSSHLLSNVLEKSFNEANELKKIVKSCKKIVKYCKKSNLQHTLETTLKSACPTRWNSNYKMMKSILDNWRSVDKILGEADIHVDFNKSSLKVVVDILGDFERIFKKLQTSSSPSICFVLPSISKILELCEPNILDLSAAALLKERILENIRKIWMANLSIWHKAAFFLYPPAAHLQEEDILEIKVFCISQIQVPISYTLSLESTETPRTPETPETPESLESPNLFPKKNKTISSENEFFFPKLVTESNSNFNESPLDEIERYIRQRVPLSQNFEVIEWWKNNANLYPQLSKLALKLLSIPASSAAAERVFSLAGNIITEKRNRLCPKSVDSLLFLHSYYKNLNNSQ